MNAHNLTTVTEFILQGLSDVPELQVTLFILFLAMYLVGVLGNTTIITLITADPKLHTPMYFLIRNLSLIDLLLMTVIVPKLLINIISVKKTISFVNCMAQLFFFVLCMGMESFLLGVMAVDRYIAICNPLHYLLVMNRRMCALLLSGCWIIGVLHSLLYCVTTSLLPFCSMNKIQQFYCDLPPLLKLSCSNTDSNELIILVEGFILATASVLAIVVSYVNIIITILRIRSREGRQKAFSTCSSHLITVTLYYVTVSFNYFRPKSSYSLEKDKFVTLMYTVVIPMLNPFIYSLRNKQVKGAFRKILALRMCSQSSQQLKEELVKILTEEKTNSLIITGDFNLNIFSKTVKDNHMEENPFVWEATSQDDNSGGRYTKIAQKLLATLEQLGFRTLN
ncbi:olfactory receptor 5J3-like [Lissotriton helveticus]